MGTRVCLGWCNLAGKGGHRQSGLGSAANSHLPACAVVPDRLWAGSWLEERGSTCRDLSACPWAKQILCWFSKHSGPRQMEMVVVSPFPLPFSWQKPMVGVSCALLTAVEFLPLASFSGTEIQGGSNSPAAASCECSSSAHGGAASPPGPAQGTGAAGFGLCLSLMPAACQCGCWRAAWRKGCSGSASRLDLHFLLRKAVVRIPPPYSGSGSWQGTSRVNRACAASSGTLQGKNSVTGRPGAGVQVVLRFCCWSAA